MSFVSWNMAMLERSQQAPLLWSMENSEAEVRSRLLGHGPDLVLFQELPGMVPFVETHSMVRANPTSHHGHLATLVRTPLMSLNPITTSVPGAAVLVTFGELTVANVHLAPGRGGWEARLDQLDSVMDACPTEALVVIGDTNARTDEEAAIAERYGLRGQLPPRPTWNSHANRFHLRSARFTSYFTRWFATEDVVVDNVEVWHRPIVHGDHRFFVSDHFAISGRITSDRLLVSKAT